MTAKAAWMNSHDEVLVYNQKNAARILGISADHFMTLGIRPTKVGNTIRYRKERLQEYLDQQDAEADARGTDARRGKRR